MTVLLVYLAAWAGRPSDTRRLDFHVLSLDSSITGLQSNRAVGLACIGFILAFVNICSRKTRIITIIHLLIELKQNLFQLCLGLFRETPVSLIPEHC
jgi:hypothetical protein